jgi:hypothetical protein
MGYWFVNTAGIGSIIVVVVGLSVLLAYAAMLRWVLSAPPTRPAPGPQAPPEVKP